MTEFASRHWIAGDRLLRRDIRLLGWELRQVVRRHGGEELWSRVTHIRRLARTRHAGDAAAEADLVDRLGRMSPGDLTELVRALGLFFDLANVAEDRHRVRVLRQRQVAGDERETFRTAVRDLAGSGLTRTDLHRLVDQLQVELVLTAHPTEAKRRTIRLILRRLHRDLELLDRTDMPRQRRARLLATMRRDLVAMWYADPLRPRRPKVIEELERNLFAVRTLWRVIPPIFRDLHDALNDLGTDPLQVAACLRFGNWIGGDRDGNPNVTVDVTTQTLRRLRQEAVRLHLRECRRIESRLIYSQGRLAAPSGLTTELTAARQRWPALNRRLEAMHPSEVHRQYLEMIAFRLRRSLIGRDGTFEDAGYRRGDDLAVDLSKLEASLRSDDLHEIADAELRAWQQRVVVFGLHLVRTDIRDNSKRLRQAVGELMSVLGRCRDWGKTSETHKQRLLIEPPPAIDRAVLDDPRVGETTRDLASLFEALQRHGAQYGPAGLGGLIISMTHEPSDALSMLWLSRVGARLAGCGNDGTALSVVPLFETYDDLDRAGYMLANLLDIPEYRRYLRGTANQQMCMVGYSDSTKDTGYLSANWALFRAQQDLAEVASRYGVDLVVFHGRGGALGRGGGPAAGAIRSLPAEAVRGRFRMTEQGEVIADRFDVPALAFRHLEQVLWAILLVSGEPQDAPRYEWITLLGDMSRHAQQAYYELISSDGFVDYFYQATPIATIEQLPISSRPARRTGQASLDDLRAIPFTFAWTQSRHFINAFYGVGTAYAALNDEQRAMLGEMFKSWPFFRSVISNAELALAKTDPTIARYYATLAGSSAQMQSIWDRFSAERDRAMQAVLAIAGQTTLLESIPWLQRGVAVRDPYLDALNLIQVELMRRISEDAPKPPADGGDRDHDEARPADGDLNRDDLQRAARLCIQAIAAGLRSTG
jgi:phosphoenolpyruvate carboxylase